MSRITATFAVIVLIVLLSACAPAGPSLEQLAGPVAQTVEAIPTASAYPTYTPLPTLAPLPTYTSVPTAEPVEIVVTATEPVVEDSEVEEMHAAAVEAARRVFDALDIYKVSLVRWNDNALEIEVGLPYASEDANASMHYDVASILALIFDPTSKYAGAFTDDIRLIFTTYSEGGDYKFTSDMSLATMHKMGAKQLSRAEWITESGFAAGQ